MPVEASAPDLDGVRVARITLAGGLLPPGEYVARAAVSAEGKPVASLTRPFRIAVPPAGAGPSRAPLAALLTEQRPYDKAELLAPELLGHYIDQVAGLVPGAPPERVLAAEAEARAGRPEAMLARLPEAGKGDARVSFLRGVSYYAGGNLNAALTQLQAALRARSDLFPAAVYMGACYAAGGKDLDAIGAWQTALIGDSGSPALYRVLADALMRVREADQAVAILDEGLAAFPEDHGPAAAARPGARDGGPLRGGPHAARRRGWTPTRTTPARCSRRSRCSSTASRAKPRARGRASEQQRLRRYAKAYIDGKGPNREVVERWLRYLDSRAGG